MVNAAAKAETLKEELDSETALFQTYQDTLATEMLSFVAREHELSCWVTKVNFSAFELWVPAFYVVINRWRKPP